MTVPRLTLRNVEHRALSVSAQTGKCSSPRLQATISARSISRLGMRLSCSRLFLAKVLDVSGATATAHSGSPAGTVAIYSATTARLKPGPIGTCLATARSHMPSMSTRPMRCGLATGGRTQSCASIPRPRNSSPSRCPIATQACGSSRAARARCGVPNRAPTSSSCSRRSRGAPMPNVISGEQDYNPSQFRSRHGLINPQP